MLTYDGAIKIIDFGIAKSQSNSEATQAGTIKGKLSYLAPEYLDGLELDARYDQFALGITLWEMLCSHKLFKENNDLAVLKKIQQCKIPIPSSINPNVPKELDEIVLKALSKDRTKRFDNLDQMNRALMKFLYAKFPDFNATDLSYFSQELFRDEIKADREKMFEFGKIDIKPYLDDLRKELESGTGGSGGAPAATTSAVNDGTGPKAREQVLDFGFEENAKKAKQTQTVKKIGANNPAMAKDIKDKPNMASSDHTGSKTNIEMTKSSVTTQKPGQTKSSVKKIDGTKTRILKNELKPVKKKTPMAAMVALFAIVLGSAVYVYFSLSEDNASVPVVTATTHPNREERKPAQVSPESKDMGQEKGNLVLSHFDKQKMQVFVDGHKMEVDLLSNIKVPLAREFTLRVQIEGKKHFVKEMRVDNSSAVEVEIPDMPLAAYGYVNTLSACAQGEIRYEIFGEKRVSPIPLTQSFGIAFPLANDDKGQAAPQSYEIFFKKRGEDIERKIEITIGREDQTIDLCDQL